MRKDTELVKRKTIKKLIDANYIGGYTIECVFEDGHVSVIDFSKPLEKYAKGYYSKYKQLNNFKRFKIDESNLVWGKDWDIIFPIDQIYKGVIR